jgi:2-dehydro-3-deoxyphosphogluconate aldolase/(4S)-4-hydroxy-2-oxoglutarate aldolase
MACADPLICSLRRQPLLVVLRPSEPLHAIPILERLQILGLIHVEIAWQPQVGWAEQMAELLLRFPRLQLGAASLCNPRGVADAASAGCRYAVSPVLDPELLQEALRRDLLLVPGVMTASEVHRARQLGCRIVKLFPAVSVGRDHWRGRRTHAGGRAALAGRRGGCGGAWIGSGSGAGGVCWLAGAALARLTSLAERQA